MISPSADRGFRLSPQQRRLFALAGADGGTAYRVACLVRLEAGATAETLRQRLEQALHRHEILRTTILCPEQMSVPLQVVHGARPAWLAEHDLSSLPAAAEQAALETLFAAALDTPFDLETGPLVHAALIHTAGEPLLLLCASAFCLDATGLRLLLAELADAPAGDGAPEPLQYPDLAAWLHEAETDPAAAQGRELWRLGREVILAAGLPRAQPAFAPAVAGPAIEIPGFAGRLAALGTSPGVFLLACWQLLLARHSGDGRALVGVSFDGRGYEELAGALGPFARVVPLGFEPPGDAHLPVLLARVEEQVREAETWQECFAWEDETVFLPHAFELEEEPAAPRCLRFYSCSDRFHVKLACRLRGDLLLAEVHHDPAAVGPAAAALLAERFHTLLASALRVPAAAAAALQLVSETERHRLLQELSRAADWRERPAEEIRPVHRLFAEQARLRPSATALIARERLTYGELHARVSGLAHQLRRLGVGPEVAVALCLERGAEAIVALLGVLAAGGCYVPLDPGQPAERLRLLVEESGARLLLAAKDAKDAIPGLPSEVALLPPEAWATDSGDSDPESEGDETSHAAYVIFTSGSTGRPKGVVVGHRQLAAYVHDVLARLDLPAGASFATLASLAADLGHTAIFPALCSGGCLHLPDATAATDPETLAARFAADPVDCLKIVPSHLAALLRAPRPERLLPRRRLVLGGELCRWELIDELSGLAAAAGGELEIFNHYGPTEATVGVLTHRVTDGPRPASASVPLGRPLAGAQVYLLDERGEPAAGGAPAEVFLGGDGIARGYAGSPALTAQRFLPDPFSGRSGARLYRTGDLARWLPAGEVEFLGRADQQVKIHGHRIELGEIEAVLARHGEVRQAAVAVRDGASGPRLAAYLVVDERRPGLAAELRAWAAERLPAPMVPVAWAWLDALPLLPNGKLDRASLPPVPANAAATERGDGLPRSAAEQILCRIWEEVLGLPRVGIHDNFFELGGDSILSIRILARASRYGLRFTLGQMFQLQTVAELAAAAGSAAAVVAVLAERGPVTGRVPLTPIQHRFFSLELPEPHHFNQTLLLEVGGEPGPAAFAQALGDLALYHDALRLRFARENGAWHQEHAPPDGAAAFTLLDLTALPEALRRPELGAAAARAQASLDLAEGPLARGVLFDLGAPAGRRLLLTVHHLAVDAVSLRVLLEDLELLLDDLDRGVAPALPPKTTSYKSWSERLAGYAREPRLQDELACWLEQGATPSLRLPVDCESRAPEVEAMERSVTVGLEPEATAVLLRQVPAAYGSRIEEALLAALAGALAAWVGEGVLAVELEGHGRADLWADVDLSRTVGWFTAVYPALLDLVPDRGPEVALAAVRERLRRVPGQGVGYGVLRYLGRSEAAALAERPAPEVRFNYLGQLDPALARSSRFRLAGEPVGAPRSPRGPRPYPLDLVGSVHDGRLWMTWSYGEGRYRRATIERLAARFLDELRALCATAGGPRPEPETPDFSLAGLAPEQLAEVLSRLDGGAAR